MKKENNKIKIKWITKERKNIKKKIRKIIKNKENIKKNKNKEKLLERKK